MDDFHREERLQSEVGIGGTGFIDLRDAKGGGGYDRELAIPTRNGGGAQGLAQAVLMTFRATVRRGRSCSAS